MRTNQSTRRRLRIRTANFRAAARETFDVKTDYAIAVHLGIHPSTLSLLMTKNTQPSDRVIVAAIDAFGKPFEELFEIVDEAA